MGKRFAIAVDGPAGSGKSTVAKAIAQKLGILYIDTGAMYRTVAYACAKYGMDASEEEKAVAVLDKMQMQILPSTDGQRILLDGEDITQRIRTPEISAGASVVASYLEVRKKLVEIQQKMASTHAVIMDGRDIATAVLPHAEVKIYLDASVKERAKRRLGELQAQGKTEDLETVQAQIAARDEQDMHRTYSPLRCAPDAVRVDTTGMDIPAVVDTLLSIIQNKIK